MVLSDFTLYMKELSKRAQLLSAVIIRRAIWNWIEAYPTELGEIYKAQTRLEGTPDELFEVLNGFSDTVRKRLVFWPTMSLLLVLCPGLLFTIGSAGNPGSEMSRSIHNSSMAKKKMFLDSLSQFLRHAGVNSGVGVNLENRAINGVGVLGEGMSAKLSETAVFCYVDLCKAATFVFKDDGGALRSIAQNIESDLRDKLFDHNRHNPETRIQSSKDVGVMGIPIQMINNPSNLTQKEKEEIKYSEDSLLDRRLMTESAASMFKLNPWNMLHGLTPILLSREAPPLFKVVLVRVCFMIVNEQFPLSWNPNIDASLAAPLRTLFAEHLSRDRFLESEKRKMDNGPYVRPLDRRHKKFILEEMNETRTEIVASILRTWCRCPLLAVARDARIIGQDEIRGLLEGISNCLLDPDAKIRVKAGEALLQLLDPDFISVWDGTRQEWGTEGFDPSKSASESAVKLFWRMSSHVLIIVSRHLLEVRADINDPSSPVAGIVAQSLLRLMHGLLLRRNEYLRRQRADINLAVISVIPERFSASAMMETALLVLLCSADPDMAITSGACLGLLLDEAEITGEATASGVDDMSLNKNPSRNIITDSEVESSDVSSPRHRKTTSLMGQRGQQPVLAQQYQYSTSIFGNILNYRDLRLLFEEIGSGLVLGPRALQKKIRKIMRLTELPSPGNIGAWEEIFKRWRGLSQMLTTKVGYTTSTVECFRNGPGIFVYNADDDDLDDKIKNDKGSERGPRPEIVRLGRRFRAQARSTNNNATEAARTVENNSVQNPNLVAGPDFIEDKGEWSNYTGFLCAMGGVCLQAVIYPQSETNKSLSRLTTQSYSHFMNESGSSPPKPNSLSSSFPGVAPSPESRAMVDR
ncbi:Neurofibromin 1, partial [Nowakowskiella sp. JEL0078]